MLNIFSAETTQAQIQANNVKTSNKTTAKKAEKTFMNSSIIRNNALTDTARLDFVLATAFVLSDFNVTSQQVVSFAASVKLDSKRLQSASQIEKHCRDNQICVIENSLLSIEDERLQKFYVDAFYSRAHVEQLQKHATDLFAFVVDYIANNEHINNAHEQAIIMHTEYVAQQKKATTRTRRTRKTAKTA